MYYESRKKRPTEKCSHVNFISYYPAGAHAWMIAINKIKRKDTRL